MKTKERILHAVLFEVIALILLTIVAIFATGKDATAMTGLAIAISLMAMTWNYIYNLIFDRFVKGERINRSFKMRIMHGLGFEGGLIIATFPVIMWVTQMPFLTVLALDIGAVIFFVLYAIAYNWAYDVIKEKFWPKQEPQSEAS